MSGTETAGTETPARVWEEDLEVLEPHFGVDDVPPPAETLLYAWQHTLVDVSPYVLPLVVAKAVGYSDAQAAYMISTCLALMGVFTFVNATWGHRLPSVMGPSATNTGAMASVGAIFGAPAMWMGAFLGGLFEAAVGASGILTRLRRFLPPYVCGIVVTTIGISLARIAGGWVFADTRPAMLTLSGLTALSVVLLTVAGYRFGLGLLARGSILLSLLLFGVVGAAAIGLADFTPIAETPWLGLPRPFAFGGPGLGWTLVGGAVFGILVGFVGSIAESIGDYAGTCAVSRVTYNVRHIRRGITVEGISSAVAPLFGAIPLTTYSQNTGVIATTRVASRRVVQVAAGILLLYGLSPKVGALLILIPRPIVGTVFLVVCGMIAVAGVRLLSTGEKDEVYMLTTAIALIAAVTLPSAAARNPDWLAGLAPLTRLLLSNSVVIATVLGISLNAILRAVLPARTA
ncbi:MAG: xanthine permease [bacterium]|nr:xanthine permease [bacterium]